ncbi:hypothetical protein ACA29_12515 [Lederbergia galactosidilytica]|uniref:Uncharacterized protein n=1 Tax=Lederbergia galactosidilytica TaxID=217031 RepID=A0A0Q9XXI5_9BACI|nr:hypothetical protein ACA29_12515 [Lederbergia galactosidilytica]
MVTPPLPGFLADSSFTLSTILAPSFESVNEKIETFGLNFTFITLKIEILDIFKIKSLILNDF